METKLPQRIETCSHFQTEENKMSNRYLRFRVSEFRSIVAIFLFLLVLTLSFGTAQRLGGRPLAARPAAADDTGWTYADHDLNGTRYSPLKQITPGNVKQLAKICSYTFPEKVPSASEPIVSAGVIYATSDHYTVALDAADCHVLWSYQWVPRATDRVHPHRGAAIANGKIIRGTGDDFLISLDAETGKLQWAKQIANPDEGHFI